MQNLTDWLDKYDIKYKIEKHRVYADEVDVSYEGIEELPDSIGLLTVKKSLNLRTNKISSFPNSIKDLQAASLELSENNISEIPDCFSDMNVTHLFLHDNKIEHLTQGFSNKKFKTVDISSNPVKDGLRFLKELDDDAVVWFEGTPFYKDGKQNIGNYRKMIDLDWELFNNKELSGAKDCYDSGLFSFKTK